MLDCVHTQLDLWLPEQFLKVVVIDFVGLAPHFFNPRHTVGEQSSTPVVPLEMLSDDMPPEIPMLAKACGMIKESVELCFKNSSVRTRNSPRNAKDSQLGVWSLTPNEARDDWIISLEVPGHLQRQKLTFSDVFTANPEALSPFSPAFFAPMSSLASLSSVNYSMSEDPHSEYLSVPAFSPLLTSWSSWSSDDSFCLDEDMSEESIIAYE